MAWGDAAGMLPASHCNSLSGHLSTQHLKAAWLRLRSRMPHRTSGALVDGALLGRVHHWQACQLRPLLRHLPRAALATSAPPGAGIDAACAPGTSRACRRSFQAACGQATPPGGGPRSRLPKRGARMMGQCACRRSLHAACRRASPPCSAPHSRLPWRGERTGGRCAGARAAARRGSRRQRVRCVPGCVPARQQLPQLLEGRQLDCQALNDSRLEERSCVG